jgi:hypothetical protein
MKMKKIKTTLIVSVIIGVLVVVGVKLYLHFFEQEYRREQAANIIPLFDPNNLQPFTDLRYPVIYRHGQKLSKSDLRNKYDTLLTCAFDTLTPWPPAERMPESFNPRDIIALGQDPGLGIKELHRQGITGKGVKAAVIDFPLLPDHEEYKENLMECHFVSRKEGAKPGQPAMHGTATASLLAGKRCGVAPGASLYFWGIPPGEFEHGYANEVTALDQIMAFNKDKPLTERIRVVSISVGLTKERKYAELLIEKLKEARESGLLVLMVYKWMTGIRCPLDKDRNRPENYEICYGFRANKKFKKEQLPAGMIYIPCDNRTTASAEGKAEYTFWASGGMSWAVPYLAGVITLAYQVNPNIKPDQMLKYVKETGTPFNKGWIINPRGLVEINSKH